MRPKRSGAHPEDIQDGQRKSNQIGNGVRKNWSKKKAQTSDMENRMESVVRGHVVDVVDWMEPTDRGRKEPARLSDVGTTEDLVDHRRQNLSHFLSWHIPVDVRFGGGGCHEGLWP